MADNGNDLGLHGPFSIHHTGKGIVMKRSIIILFSACALCMVSGNALADRPPPGGGHRPPPHRPSPPRHHHSHTSVGISFGAPLWTYPAYSPYYPYYPYGPYYPYPPQTIVIQSTPTQYIEKDEGESAEHYWYYCPDPKGYYPYVPKCNAAWQKVTPFPQETR